MYQQNTTQGGKYSCKVDKHRTGECQRRDSEDIHGRWHLNWVWWSNQISINRKRRWRFEGEGIRWAKARGPKGKSRIQCRRITRCWLQMMDRHKHQTNHLSLSLFQRESIEHFWSMKCPEIWEHKGSVELNERAWTESKAEGLGDTKEWSDKDSSMATTTTKTCSDLKSTKICYSWNWNRDWGGQKHKDILNFDVSELSFLDIVYIPSKSTATEIKWDVTLCFRSFTDHGGYADHTPRNSWVWFSCT